MGLDMYLSKRNYIWSEDRKELKITLKKDSKYRIDARKVSEIVEEAGYWRKANAIHAWFVENVQDGNDDCGDYYVSQESMKKLLDICETILKTVKTKKGTVVNGYKITDKGKEPILEDGEEIVDSSIAEELLPTSEGFFFGSTNYDQWYLEDLRHTVEVLKEALSNEGSYYYSSSW